MGKQINLTAFILIITTKFLLIIVFLFSCKNPEQKRLQVSSLTNTSCNEFQGFFRKFQNSFSFDEKNIKQFAHPDYGLFLLYSRGALPEAIQLEKSAAFPDYLIRLLKRQEPADSCHLSSQEFPEVNCDLPEVYEERGCFLQKNNTLRNHPAWNHIELTSTQQWAKDQLDQYPAVSILITNIPSTFVFSCIGGEWFLAFLDIRKPCEA